MFVRGCLDLLAGVDEGSSATQFFRGFPTEALPPVLRNHRYQSSVIWLYVRSCLCSPSSRRAGLNLATDGPQEGSDEVDAPQRPRCAKVEVLKSTT